jgi:ragulator complex protein LAMTOR3
MNKNPVILTFVGSESCNAGHIMSLENELDKYLDDYKLAVVDH